MAETGAKVSAVSAVNRGKGKRMSYPGQRLVGVTHDRLSGLSRR